MNAAQRAALLNPQKAKSMSLPTSPEQPDFSHITEFQHDVETQTRNVQDHVMVLHNQDLNHNSTDSPLVAVSETEEATSTIGLIHEDSVPSQIQNCIFEQLATNMDNNGGSLAEDLTRAPKSATTSTPGAPSWQPKDLISPRSKRTRDALAETNDTNDSADEAFGPGSGQSNLLMKQFGVGEREYIPHKRHKSDQDDQHDDKVKSKFSGGSKNGPLGEEIKRLRDEGAAEAGPSALPAPIDLTADDEDEIQIVKDVRLPPSQDREVCMGMTNAKIMADRIPTANNRTIGKLTQNWPPCKITLRPQPGGSGIVIEALDARGNPFGKLDAMTANALSQPLKTPHLSTLRLVTILTERPRTDGEQPGHPCSKSMDCRITLYSDVVKVESIGRYLSHRNLFLSKPPIVELGKQVVNPHVPNYKVIPKTANGSSYRVAQVGYKERSTEEIRNDVLGMFDRLIKSDELPTMEADGSVVETELMEHQKQALHFLTQQESHTTTADAPPSNLWKESYKKDGTKTFYNVITGDEMKGRVELSLGGIFADMMGLGKTLSVLSRICASLDEARTFGDSKLPAELDDHPTAMRNTMGTLIVCPKSVLSNWDEQIKAHLNKNKVKFYVYHGSKREQDIDELAKYEIVITAYTTVGSEYKSNSGNYSAIGKLNWYRVVLDEAHMIRNQDTGVFKAACEIVSKRRWAVTGTPIQNRLDDLGALIRFLKIFPFHRKGSFEQHFLAPFKAGDPQVISNLHLLVGSMTLRRSKDKIELPDRIESLVRLEFSDSESALYQAFAKDSNRKLNAMIGGGRLKGRSYAHVLVSITRLRLVCAHGRELLTEDDMKMLAGSSWDTAIDLGEEEMGEKPAMTEEQIYDTFYLLRESNMDVCSRCSETIGRVVEGEVDDYDDEAITNDVIGYMTPCLHTICPRCINDFKADLAQTMTKDSYAVCPTCEQYIKAVLPPVRQSRVQADLERRQVKKLQPTKKGGHYGGPHTKVRALLTDLLRFREQSKELMDLGEPPIRSVVFSGWTQYLDLIEIALKDNEIPFLRLDGKMSVPQRSRVMEQFKTDPDFTVILVSIKAGGQGLNFTAANKVFMMEPQFNPGVEMQAVDRVHRLGQKRDVEIKRFIMGGSFEEKIVELQRKKVELAQLAHQTGKGEKESLKEKMESLRSLFR